MQEPTSPSWVCWRDRSHPTVTTPAGWPQCASCGASPAYHERGALASSTPSLSVFAPRLERRPRWAGTLVALRAAIVETPVRRQDETVPPTERVAVHLEGWVHGPAQYGHLDARGLWAAGVDHAADRAITGYPTIAVASLPREDLVVVGSYLPNGRILTLDEDTHAVEALTAWIEA